MTTKLYITLHACLFVSVSLSSFFLFANMSVWQKSLHCLYLAYQIVGLFTFIKLSSFYPSAWLFISCDYALGLKNGCMRFCLIQDKVRKQEAEDEIAEKAGEEWKRTEEAGNIRQTTGHLVDLNICLRSVLRRNVQQKSVCNPESCLVFSIFWTPMSGLVCNCCGWPKQHSLSFCSSFF